MFLTTITCMAILFILFGSFRGVRPQGKNHVLDYIVKSKQALHHATLLHQGLMAENQAILCDPEFVGGAGL